MDEDQKEPSGISHVQSPLKRTRIDQDPDYDEAAPPDLKRLKVLEDNARLDLAKKVSLILTKQLEIEVERQQSEIAEIEQSIMKVQQNLHLLRHVATKSYYSTKNLQTNTIGNQPVIHPTVKNHLGKHPKSAEETPSSHETQLPTSELLKVPQYIPPKIPETVVGAPIRGERHCVKKKLIIGNVSKWIPVSERDDSASHKWMVYVRGSKQEPDISPFVSKVNFFLHPSYAPHDIVSVSSHPFHVTRRGWGEFPLRVQVFFHNPLCKPINIIHHLKLDRSYTGLQTLGSETVVDVMIYDKEFSIPSTGNADDTANAPDGNNSAMETEDHNDPIIVKTEPLSTSRDDCDYSEMPNILVPSSPDIKKEPDLDNFDFECGENHLNSSPATLPELNDNSNCDSGISERTVESNSQPESLLNGNKESDSDHDYMRPNEVPTSKSETAATCAANSATSKLTVQKSAIARLQSSPLLTKPLIISTRSGSASTSTSSTGSQPVLVRCVSKNGTTFSLPLTLLRSAVVIKPYHLVKPGESVLRPPVIKTCQEIQGQVVKPASAVRIVLPSNAKFPLTAAKVEARQVKKEEKPDTESKFLLEKKNFEQLVAAVQSTPWVSVRDCVRILARNLNLIDEQAADPMYRSLRPFAACSLDVFNSWNIGKQRSAEWTRACLIKQIMKQCKFVRQESAEWTTKRILIWCRRQGYSPLSCWPVSQNPQQENDVTTSKTLAPVQITSIDPAHDEGDVVDVESVDPPRPRKNAVYTKLRNETTPLEDSDPDLTNWLVESIEKLGFKLGTESLDEIHAPFSRLLLSQLWKRIADDLIRRSLRQSWERTGGVRPNAILLSDALNAVVRRPEFDLLTNKGLGVDE